MKNIKPEDLVPMDLFTDDFPLRIELAYARPNNYLFGERIYHYDAHLWLHKDLACVVLLASALCYARTKYSFVLYDGLRTVDAQEAMLETSIVRKHPHWLEEPRLLSLPGGGGHPRAMAVDVVLEDEDGNLVEMGTPFDHLAEKSDAKNNPAHRDYAALFPKIAENRNILSGVMRGCSQMMDTPILPLPEEWWDFRLPPEITNEYAPLRDSDLPPSMRMVESAKSDETDLSAEHFLDLKQDILLKVTPHILSSLQI